MEESPHTKHQLKTDSKADDTLGLSLDSTPANWKNQLYYGDNLDILRQYIKDQSVDLIYLDPPFNSGATYSILFEEKTGEKSQAQIKAFEDTWHWGPDAEESYFNIVKTAPKKVADLMQAYHSFLGTSDMMAYLTMMAPRLLELHRVLKPAGSIYLHCDPTASHYLKLLLDAVFGHGSFRNEIIWHYTGGGRSKSYFSHKHDIIFWYTRGSEWSFNIDEVRVPYKETSGYAKAGIISAAGKKYEPNPLGTPIDDVWDIPIINPLSKERLGYPTQKPELLLERIIKASSRRGDVVLDPFCGCGTAVAVAERLGRRWIGIDITHLAIALIKGRLHDTFKDQLSPYAVIGVPKDLEGAMALAQQSRYQFQCWAVGLLTGQPEEEKRGADKGIDGYMRFFDDDSGKAKEIIIQVKSGHVSSSQIRDLKGTMQRENAAIALFITLEEPTEPMKQEAVTASFYIPEHFATKKYPRIQILTVKELLDGKRPDYPEFGAATFKKAQFQDKPTAEQDLLF